MAIAQRPNRRGDIVTTPEISSRLKRLGLKGAPNLQAVEGLLIALALVLDDKDAGQVDYPRFFVRGGITAALAANNSSVSLQGAAKRTVLDKIIVSTSVATRIEIRSNVVGSAGNPMYRRNVGRDQAANVLSTVLARVTTQQVGAPVGDLMGSFLIASNAPTQIEVGYRLGSPATALLEEVGIWNFTQNQDIFVIFFGREWDDA